MSDNSSPIDIASPNKRYSSNSPRNQASNLTFALQQAGPAPSASPAPPSSTKQSAVDVKPPGTRSDSLSVPFGSSHTASRPISVGKRRDSTLGGSYMGGMSWGGMSMGSFVQDDIMMGGLSPSLNSPSLHSSSYLPRMEANFWNNMKCCDTTFGNLHELVAHFEDVHKQAPSTFPYAMSAGSERLPRRKSSTTNPGEWRGSNPAAMPVRGFHTGSQPNARFPHDASRKQSTINMQDMDTIGEMELDDEVGGQTEYNYSQQNVPYSSETTPQMSAAVPSTQGMNGHSGFQSSNSSTPPGGTPMQPNFNSSLFPQMNQSAFGTQAGQQTTPQQSHQPNISDSQNFGQGTNGAGFNPNAVAFDTSVLSRLNTNFGSMSFGSNNNDMVDLCINEPAKNLYSSDGGFNSQQYPHFNFTTNKSDHLSKGDENAKKLQAQRLAAGIGKQQTEEERPFKCPVIGCEKAYKNANGLRYHEKHGHSTQKLAENGDGTFSIVDPVTSIPYPGTVGMEKEKPYRCEVCGKRYKNLNGLKYHRNHSPPCNPDFNTNTMPNLHADLEGETVY